MRKVEDNIRQMVANGISEDQIRQMMRGRADKAVVEKILRKERRDK